MLKAWYLLIFVQSPGWVSTFVEFLFCKVFLIIINIVEHITCMQNFLEYMSYKYCPYNVLLNSQIKNWSFLLIVEFLVECHFLLVNDSINTYGDMD